MLDRVGGMREIDISASVLDCGTVTAGSLRADGSYSAKMPRHWGLTKE